jgi:spore maturation protein CgeB
LKQEALDLVFIGLSITSSWGNGHATTYRGLLRELARRGHRLLFLERDVPWYAQARDMPRSSYCDIQLYSSLEELRSKWAARVNAADAVILGSFVPQGIQVGEWVLGQANGLRVFYDIDTPVTLAQLAAGSCEFLSASAIPEYDLYLSFTGGPMLGRLEHEFGARQSRPLYCSVDTEDYFPEPCAIRWDLAYMGTYSIDRQEKIERLLFDAARAWPAGRFAIAGSMYPSDTRWPANVDRIDHLPPDRHRHFYNSQRFTLNVTREDMIRAGYSPSVRLFEAAACGTPMISDGWPGLDHFFQLDKEIFIAESGSDCVRLLRDTPSRHVREVAANARRRTLAHNSAACRALELEQYLLECRARTQGAPLLASGGA